MRQPSPEDVRERAAEIAETRGDPGWVTLDDWIEAECDLLFWESSLLRS